MVRLIFVTIILGDKVTTFIRYHRYPYNARNVLFVRFLHKKSIISTIFIIFAAN